MDRVEIRRDKKKYEEDAMGPIVSRRAFETVWKAKGYKLHQTVERVEAEAETAAATSGGGSSGGTGA